MSDPVPTVTEAQIRTALRKEIEENGPSLLRGILKKLRTAVFPATPKIMFPESGTNVIVLMIDLYVSMKTNRGDKPYRMSVVDLTDGTNAIPDTDIPAPGGSPPVYFAATIPYAYLISGHDYKIQIAVRPDVAGANDETDTTYITVL